MLVTSATGNEFRPNIWWGLPEHRLDAAAMVELGGGLLTDIGAAAALGAIIAENLSTENRFEESNSKLCASSLGSLPALGSVGQMITSSRSARRRSTSTAAH